MSFSLQSRKFFKKKRGVVHLILILIVLLVSTAIVFYVTRNFRKSKAVDNSVPRGTIHATPTTVFEYGFKDASITLNATDVTGANGAQVDNVRYYLLNPTLASGNNWGNPDWCSDGSCNSGAYITYDISQSSNPGDNYAIVWNSSTHSSGSTPYSRALTPANIPPGIYTVGLRVEDVNGNVSGGASSLQITVTNSSTSPGFLLKITQPQSRPSVEQGGSVVAFTISAPNTTPPSYAYYQYYLDNHMDPSDPIFGIDKISFSPVSGTLSPGQSVPIYLNVKGYPTPLLNPGLYTIVINVKDGLGNIYSQYALSVSFYVIIKQTDSDGFSDALERYIGTSSNLACGVNAWPPDFNNDHRILVDDIVKIVNKNNTTDPRYDLNGDGTVNQADVDLVKSYYRKTCTP